MDKRTLLYNKKNIDMVYNITLKKLKQLVYKDEFERIMPEYDKLFFDVMDTIFKEELKLPLQFNQDTILKINNIVIKEACAYIVDYLKKPVEIMSTPLDNISEISLEKEDYIDELKRENESKPKELENIPPVPQFNEDIYEISSTMMTMEDDIYTTDIYIPDAKSVEVIQMRIDRSEYMITEYNNKMSFNGKRVELYPGNYNNEDFVDFFQRLLDIHVNSNKEQLMNVMITFEKRRDIFVIVYKKLVPEEKKISDFTLDFSMENSIGEMLGFEKKKYQIKIDTEVEGKKHRLNYPTQVYCHLDFTEEIKTVLSIPLDVAYNETKFYNQEYKKILYSKEPLFTIDHVKVKLLGANKKPYNTRNRPFFIRFKVITLI